jgi:hypothetical protein
MSILAKKYGISDVGLAKICRKLAIPLPGRGHWAKKEAGQKIEPLPLPPLKERIILSKPVPRPEPPRLADFATQAELAQVEQLESAVDEVMLKRGSLSHPLITQARPLLGKAQCDERGILWTREPCLDIQVSKDSLDRALRIMAALLGVIEDAGFTTSVETRDRQHHTIAKIHGQEIRFGLVEKVDRIEISAPPKGGLLEGVLTFAGKPVKLEATGRLSITVWTAWGSDRKRWTDEKATVEQQLWRVVAGFIRLALMERAAKDKQAAEERERQRAAQERAQLEGLIRAEKSKVRALRFAAAKWSRAEQIRAFISAVRDAGVQNDQPVEAGSVLGDWTIWAQRQADRLDPLKESPPSITDRIPEQEPACQNYYGYGYRKPDPPFRLPKPIWRMK